MDIINIYFEKPFMIKNGYEYNLRQVSENFFIGQDSQKNTVVVISSNDPQRGGLCLKTNKMVMKCNIEIDYELNDKINHEKVYLLSLNSSENNEVKIFLKLCQTYFLVENLNMDSICDTFSILSAFFKKKKEIYSDNELQGLYAELYTIYYYKDRIDFAKYWQSKDKLKFDFSLNSKTKLEIKSTKSNIRNHHFLHEQLATQLYDIYVLSYKLRYDDQGLSLLELISLVEPLFEEYANQKMRLLKIIHNTSDEKLSTIRFSEEYIKESIKMFLAKDIPQFNERSVMGVTDANYTCLLDGVEECDINDTISLFINVAE